MKKLKKVIWLIVGLIIGISTTVGAATVFNSKDITYSSSATTKTNVKDSLDELYTKASQVGKCPEGYACFKTDSSFMKLNIGDYISMTPISTSYTISKDLTGYTSDQTINPSELKLWRVIRKNNDGTVDIVSDKTSSKTVYFQGKNGYINFIKGLNTIASQYTDGVHVLKAREIGYSNQTETITDTSMLTKTSAPWDKSTTSGWTATSSGFTEAEEKQGAGDIGYQTDYLLVNSVYGTMVAKNPSDSASNYWLASRDYRQEGAGWYYGGHFTTSVGTQLTSGALYFNNYGFKEQRCGYAVRPVVTLISTAKISSGDGTEFSPYKLN